MNVLKAKGTEAQNNVVCANAAVAINTVKKTGLEEGIFETQKKACIRAVP